MLVNVELMASMVNFNNTHATLYKTDKCEHRYKYSGIRGNPLPLPLVCDDSGAGKCGDGDAIVGGDGATGDGGEGEEW